MSGEFVVDIVIAIHDPSRRIDRAVSSLSDPAGRVRVTVVCHGLAAESIADRIPAAPGGVIRIVEFADGVASPAGPFNHGLALATAEYVMIMGSDDFLEPGAMATWVDAVSATGADIQLVPLRYQDGELLANPLTRPWRRHRLDPVRDRLFHRTAPLALIRRDLSQMGDGPLSASMPVGEDLAWSSALWTSPVRIDFDPGHPAYVIGGDAESRVTMQLRDVSTVLEPVDMLLASEWAALQPSRVRRSLVAKLVRVNIIGAIRSRPDAESWHGDARERIAGTIAIAERFAADGFEDLPRADRALLDVVASAEATSEAIAAAVGGYRQASRADRLFPRRVTRAFGRESVLRRYARYAVDGRR